MRNSHFDRRSDGGDNHRAEEEGPAAEEEAGPMADTHRRNSLDTLGAAADGRDIQGAGEDFRDIQAAAEGSLRREERMR